MRIDEIPTSELRRIATATERAVGPDSPEVRAMRRELERREKQQQAGGRKAATDAR